MRAKKCCGCGTHPRIVEFLTRVRIIGYCRLCAPVMAAVYGDMVASLVRLGEADVAGLWARRAVTCALAGKGRKP